MGRHRLHADLRRVDAGVRPTRRHARPSARVPAWHRRQCSGLPGMCRVAVAALAAYGTGRSGDRCRPGTLMRPGACHRAVSRAPAQPDSGSARWFRPSAEYQGQCLQGCWCSASAGNRCSGSAPRCRWWLSRWRGDFPPRCPPVHANDFTRYAESVRSAAPGSRECCERLVPLGLNHACSQAAARRRSCCLFFWRRLASSCRGTPHRRHDRSSDLLLHFRSHAWIFRLLERAEERPHTGQLGRIFGAIRWCRSFSTRAAQVAGGATGRRCMPGECRASARRWRHWPAGGWQDARRAAPPCLGRSSQANGIGTNRLLGNRRTGARKLPAFGIWFILARQRAGLVPGGAYFEIATATLPRENRGVRRQT